MTHTIITYMIQAETCQACLYAMYNKDIRSDPTPAPTPVWKKVCKECILLSVAVPYVHEHTYLCIETETETETRYSGNSLPNVN